MFNIGDKIVYPTQGVGVVKNIEEKEFFGEKQQYHKIQLINNGMEIMIPTSRISLSNLRLVSDFEILEESLINFEKSGEKNDLNPISNAKERININNTKLKSGLLIDYIDVLYSLTEVNKKKTLNINEKQMLLSARKFLVDEISLSKSIASNEADEILERYIG